LLILQEKPAGNKLSPKGHAFAAWQIRLYLPQDRWQNLNCEKAPAG
jgi:hypothetical protein